MTDPGSSIDRLYRQRSDQFGSLRDRCAARSRLIAHSRMLVFLAAVASFVWLIELGLAAGPFWFALPAFLGLLFVYLVVHHNRLNLDCRRYDDLVRLNVEGRHRLARDWDALPGVDPVDEPDSYPVASDLDLFGAASLFALLGTVGTPPGSTILRQWLLESAEPETIRARQAAVEELAPLIDLRERITVAGRRIAKTSGRDVETFLGWAEGEPWLLHRRWVIWTARLLPLVPLALIIMNIAGLVSYFTWLTALAFNLAFTSLVGRDIHLIFDRAFVRENAFQQYAEILEDLSETSLRAAKLLELQAPLAIDRVIAHQQMKKLHRLLSLAETRYSSSYLPIQAATLWDFHVLWRLEKWQMSAGRRARAWLAALAEFDALAALATLRHDNPDWTFPEIREDGERIVVATGLGHPLIPNSVRVINDVSVGPPGTFLFITGSNMSGKSTLLRAIGTNIVLARAGAPVCAGAMRLPPLKLETSMRIHDSLQLGLSHFMAELKRLKQVVDAARRERDRGDGVFLYLMDDILQGTNTAERQIAARKIISHLLSEGAIGAVTSHDLSLADTDELATASIPVHFTERIEKRPTGIAISFDYKLRPGIATSQNALKLLEVVGLDADTPIGPAQSDAI